MIKICITLEYFQSTVILFISMAMFVLYLMQHLNETSEYNLCMLHPDETSKCYIVHFGFYSRI